MIEFYLNNGSWTIPLTIAIGAWILDEVLNFLPVEYHGKVRKLFRSLKLWVLGLKK
jgi:hypothetical protein